MPSAFWLMRLGRPSSNRQRSLAALALLLLAACPKKTAIWLEPGSTPSHIVFLVSNKVHGKKQVDPGILRVDRCETYADSRSRPAWIIWGSIESRDAPYRVVYGEVPAGFAESHPADSLDPGCYQVHTGGTGSTWIEVSATSVHQRERPAMPAWRAASDSVAR